MSPVPREGPDVSPAELVFSMPDPLKLANRIRFLKTSELDGVEADVLVRCARRCRAAAYSLTTAARRFEHRAELLTHPPKQAERPMDEPTPDPGGSPS